MIHITGYLLNLAAIKPGGAMKIRQLFFLLLLGNPVWAQSGSYFNLEAIRQVIPLDGRFLLYIYSTGERTLDEVTQPAFLPRFQPMERLSLESNDEMAFWLKASLTSRDSLNDWLLVFKDPNHGQVENLFEYLAGNQMMDAWFLSKNGEEQHRRTGFLVPASEKIFDESARVNAVRFSLPAGDSLDVFLRVQNVQGDPVNLSAELRAPNMTLPLNTAPWASRIFLFIGVSGILGVLSFFFYFFVRDWSYLLFGMLAAALAVHYTLLHPDCLFITAFTPERPRLALYFWVILTHIFFVFFTLFGRSFTGLRRLSRRLDNAMLALTGIMLFSMAGSLVNLAAGWDFPFMMIFFVAMASVLLLGIRIFFLPGRLTRIFGAGAVWLCFFSGLGFLWQENGLDLPFNPWPVSQMGLMVIYTLGLAYKLHLNEQAKADAQRVLELDVVKSRFFANISHEFRTPLTLILGPLKKAQEQLPASDQEVFYEAGSENISLPARHVGMMRRNAERLGQLIDQLLDLSKLENGSMKLQVAEYDAVPFLRAMVFSFESLAERQQIHFQTEFPEAGQFAFFDKDKLEKIIVNLLSNAFKYTPEKGMVSVKSALEKGRLKITVADSGPGISKEDLDKIFERFYQVEGTEDKGTGIGLSLVKELVELHRGQISVESAPGKGTAFKVSLPVSKEAFDSREVATAPVEATGAKSDNLPVFAKMPIGAEISGSETTPPSDHPLLLIVEDNPDLRRFIAETMQGEYQILTAENGRIGLTAALEHTPDLIVSDVMMPEMDGFTLCEKIKTDEHTSHIPVILLTAKAGQQHKIAGLETGADAYLTKPFDEKELLVRARNLVEQRRKLRDRFAGIGNLREVRRLRPDEIAVTSADERFLQKVAAAVEENMDNEFFSVEDLAGAVAFSRSQLHRKLKALTGESPTNLIREFRLTRAKELLEKGHGNVSEVAIEVGYSSLSYFTRSFKEAFGILPSEVLP